MNRREFLKRLGLVGAGVAAAAVVPAVAAEPEQVTVMAAPEDLPTVDAIMWSNINIHRPLSHKSLQDMASEIGRSSRRFRDSEVARIYADYGKSVVFSNNELKWDLNK